jgi:TRAP-type uncharacterized transport system fused permease subunit
LLILRHSPQLAAYRSIEVLAILIVVQNLVRAYLVKASLIGAFKLSLRQLWESLILGARNFMGIGVVVAAVGIIIGVVSMGLGGMVTEIVDKIAGGNFLILLIATAVASLILGMGIPTTPNYVILASLTVPVIVTLGASYGMVFPVIAAHLFCFFFGIMADDTPPVCLGAFAAAAIAKSDPIKTGIQGFTYDLRTGLLPFMFIYNPELLMYGVTSWWHAAYVFCSGVLGMLAFTALTMNFFTVKNRIYESVLFGLITFIFFQPALFVNHLHFGNKFVWYGIGLALFTFIYLSQLPRVRAVAKEKV